MSAEACQRSFGGPMVACHLRQDATGDTGMETTLSDVQERKFSLRSFGPLFEWGIALLPVPSYQLGGGLWYWLGPGLFFWCCFPLPASRRRHGRSLAQQVFPLGVHLQEQQAGDLLHVIAIGKALVAQHMGVVPDFGDELCVGHAGVFLVSNRSCASASADSGITSTASGSA
jgi:hypothetical protein